MSNNLTLKLSGIAESIKAEVLFDLKLNVSPNTFYRAKFDKERNDEKTLCHIIYN